MITIVNINNYYCFFANYYIILMMSYCRPAADGRGEDLPLHDSLRSLHFDGISPESRLLPPRRRHAVRSAFQPKAYLAAVLRSPARHHERLQVRLGSQKERLVW